MIDELLSEGHGVVSDTVRSVASILGIHPPSLLLDEAFPRDWIPPEYAQRVFAPKQDPEEVLAMEAMKKLFKAGKARLARKLLEAAID